MRACVRECVRACVCVCILREGGVTCVCACVSARTRARGCVLTILQMGTADAEILST